jgi:hypothetical protein
VEGRRFRPALVYLSCSPSRDVTCCWLLDYGDALYSFRAMELVMFFLNPFTLMACEVHLQ